MAKTAAKMATMPAASAIFAFIDNCLLNAFKKVLEFCSVRRRAAMFLTPGPFFTG
jgi:hypothetical protein